MNITVNNPFFWFTTHFRTSTATVTGWNWETTSHSATSYGQISPWKTWQVWAYYIRCRLLPWGGQHVHETFIRKWRKENPPSTSLD